MKSLGRTLLVLLVLLLCGAGAAGTYVYFIWHRSDELLRQGVVEKLREIAPGWNFEIRSAWFDFGGRVHLKDVIVPGDDPARPILESSEVVLVVDRESLTRPEPDIRRIQFVNPRMNLSRGVDGGWNFQRLPPLRHPKSVVPEFLFERGTLTVFFDRAQGAQAAAFRFENVDVQMIPAGKRQFLIKTSAKVPFADELVADGTLNIDEGTWSLKGHLGSVKLDWPLLRLAAEFSPDARAALGRFDAAATTADDDRGIEVSAAANLQFRIGQWQAEASADYQVSVQLLEGKVNHPAIEYPLRDLHGRLEIDNHRIDVQELTAKTGATHLRVERGGTRRVDDAWPADFDMVVTDLPLDERLYRLLPEEDRDVYDSLNPAGQVGARLHFEFNGRDRWEHEGEVTVRDCTATHVKFPYRVEKINGTIKHAGDLVELKLTGMAGAQRIDLRGRIKDPGREQAALFIIETAGETAGIPIDEKLRAACPAGVRAAIDRLNLHGLIDGWVQLSRRAGPGQPVVPEIHGRLRSGSANLDEFPYPLSKVTGRFVGTPQEWTFTEFHGRNGEAELAFNGRFRPVADDLPQLEMEFEARNAPCDRVLFEALPPHLKEAWQEINPEGTLHLTSGRLSWSAGERLQIGFDASLHEGRIMLDSLPLPLEAVEADFNWNDGRVTIRSASGRREEMRFRASGYIEFPDADEWHLHLDDLHVDDLEADRAFRKALPERLRTIVEAFNPRGKLSISGKLDFRGRKGDEYPVTAAWNTTTVYTGNMLTAGIDLKDMHGTARFLGEWDGETVSGEGWIDLNSVKVFDYQLANVTGPISIDGKQLFVGSKEAAASADWPVAAGPKRLTARFIEGVVGLDAAVDLTDAMTYRARISLDNGELKRFAQTYLPNHRNLAGVMNGRVVLQGEGADARRLKGSGRLLIAPAALYELPLIIEIFQALTLTPPKNAAFEEAFFDFRIRNSTVEFGRIDMVGDAMRLVGLGQVRFNGAVNMEFLSNPGRKQIPIPLLGEAIKIGTSGLVGVKVGGTVQAPETRKVLLPGVDKALQQFLQISEPRAGARRWSN